MSIDRALGCFIGILPATIRAGFHVVPEEPLLDGGDVEPGNAHTAVIVKPDHHPASPRAESNLIGCGDWISHPARSHNREGFKRRRF
jgi:hypothetical protein